MNTTTSPQAPAGATQTARKFILYTVGGYYRLGAPNSQTMWPGDADALTLAQAERLADKLGLNRSDIREV